VNAVLQFWTTRLRAGRAEYEGEAQEMWLRYPFTVIVNAMVWTLMISTVGRFLRPLRRGTS
jgi:hypothetical protein